MKIRILILALSIFVSLVGIMAADGGNVKYTFDKNAVAAKNAADSVALAKEMANPYVNITTTASAYNKIGDWTADPGTTLLVIDTVIEDHGYEGLLIAPEDFSVRINGTEFPHGISWTNLESINRKYLTGELRIGPSAFSGESDGEIQLYSGDVRRGSLLFRDIPLNIEKYELIWARARDYNTTIDGVYSGNENAVTWTDRGNAFDHQGKYDDAIQAYDEAIRLDPNYAIAWSYKGNVLRELGKYDEAIVSYNGSILLDPSNAVAWSGKGAALYKLGKYDDAIQAYDEAIRLYPSYANAWYNKGYALYEQGKYNETIKCFDEATRLDPSNANAWYNKGVALDALGKTTEADAAFAKANELGYTG